MPKGFSERERTLIRAQLLAKGRELFATQGIKKANVEDLTRAAGISKGAFYLFYNSKEELFFELMEQFEDEFKANMLKEVALPGQSPRARFKAQLNHAVAAWKTNPLFTYFSKEEYAYLVRKLPEEKIRAHTRGDDMSAAELIGAWQRAGVAIEGDARMLANMLKALFFISLHEEDFDADVYPQLIETYVDLLAGHFVAE
jgi:AcrR family transcriptional regulator